jgi:hypothetical protein
MIPPRLYADLLSKRFEPGGRGPDAYDCVGIAIEVARRMGRPLPAFLSSESEFHAQLADGGTRFADLERIAEAEPGCIVAFEMRPDKHHIAIMIDRFRFLHAASDVGIVCERVLSPSWQRKIIGFYRLEPTEAQ